MCVVKLKNVENLLRGEITEVVGCTEPAAIAYAVQRAKRHLAGRCNLKDIRVELTLSPEVLRNASTAVVPVIGKRGIKAAVVAGLLSTASGFNPFANLKAPQAHPLLTHRSWLSVVPSKRRGIYIFAALMTPEEQVTVEVRGRHDFIVHITHNGKTLSRTRRRPVPALQGMREIAAIVARRDRRLESLARDFIVRQVQGDPSQALPGRVAALVGARMRGQPLPVLTITGSGNQGIFLALPLFDLYKSQGRRVLPAVLFALLTQIYLSQIRRRISTGCGLESKAAPALAAGLAYAQGKEMRQIMRVMRIARERAGAIACHGARPSCGTKAAHILKCVLAALGKPPEL